MRVLMTADAVGGVWSYALQLAEALQPWGVEIALATQGPRPTADQRGAAARLSNVQLSECDYRLEWMEDPWDDVADAGDWLLELAHNVQPDVIHLNDYSHGALPWNAPVLIAGHSCVFSWFAAVRKARPDAAWDRYFQSVRDGLAAAQMVVAPTQAMLDWLQQFYGPLSEVRVIYNGIDPLRFHPRLKEQFVFVAGRIWDEAKNIAAVVNAAPQMRCPVKVAGSTALQNEAPRKPRDCHPWVSSQTRDEHRDPGKAFPGLPGVTYLGRLSQSDMIECYGCAAVYALPARYEPFGLTPLEAGLSGCALILGDIPSLREVWGDAAWFVSPDDEDELVAAVNRLVSDDHLRKRFQQSALAHARQFTAERMAVEYFNTYSELIAKAPPSERRNSIPLLEVSA